MPLFGVSLERKEKTNVQMRAYFSIRTFNNNEYAWPDPLGDKGEAAVVIEDVGDSLECGRLFAYTDNYPYFGIEFFAENTHFCAEHRHSRLYWDGCVWTNTLLEDFKYLLEDRVRLFVNGRHLLDVGYEQFARVVKNMKKDDYEPQYKCTVAVIDPRVRFLALASLAYFDEKGAKAKCELYKRLNPTRQEAMAVLRRFGLDVGFGPNKADEDTVYGHLNDFCTASKNETPAQILGRSIPLRVECEEPVELGNLDAGSLFLSLANEQIGVVLRGVETVGGVRKTYAFSVPTEWARKSVVNIIEKMSVAPTMPTDREGYPSRSVIRIVKGDGVFSLAWGGVIGGTWHPLVRMAKKLRLVYDMLKEDAATGVEETAIRLVGEFKIANTPMDYIVSSLVFQVGKELLLCRSPNGEKSIQVQDPKDGHVLGVVSPMFSDVLDALLENDSDVKARIESSCSHQGKPSACVVVVRGK